MDGGDARGRRAQGSTTEEVERLRARVRELEWRLTRTEGEAARRRGSSITEALIAATRTLVEAQEAVERFDAVGQSLASEGLGAALFNVDTAGGTLRLTQLHLSARGGGGARRAPSPSYEVPYRGVAVCRRVVEGGECVFVADMQGAIAAALPEKLRWSATLIGHFVAHQRCVLAPVRVSGEVTHVLAVFGEGVTAADRPGLAAFAEVLGGASTRAQLAQALERSLSRLHQTHEQLLQAQKMHAIGQLVGGIAHDFNNLLTVIRGGLELLVDSLPEAHEGHTSAALAREATERAAGLARQLLGFSRPSQAVTQRVAVNDVVRDMTRLLERVLGEGVTLRLALDPGAPRIEMDPSHLEQALLNLVLNARDAMPEGGEVVVETTCAWRPAGSEEARSMVGVRVIDQGVGMDASTRARVLEPFFTTKGGERGTGLGLAVVANIARERGGEVEVESAPGQGATLTVWLPRSDAPGAAAGRAAAPADALGAVLLVEEAEVVARMISRGLRDAGYRVVVASSLEIARRWLRSGEAFSVVVCDLRLHDRERLSLVRGWQASGVPVVMTTGYDEPDAAAHSLPPGVPVLRKPYSIVSLLQTLRGLGERSFRAGRASEVVGGAGDDA